MVPETGRLVSDLGLSAGSSLLVFGDVGLRVLESLAPVLGGLENITLLYREPEPPTWARTLTERGLKVRRSLLLEHNDFLPASSFDAILALNVLDKLLGKREFLSESFRLLKPGGRLLIVQRLWPLTSLRRGEFRRLVDRSRSFTLLNFRAGLISGQALLERPAQTVKA